MSMELVLAVSLAACLAVLIVFIEIRDKRIDREEKDFFRRAIRVYGTVTDFGLPDVKYQRSQRFCALYEIDGKQYTVDSGLIAKGCHVYAVGRKGCGICRPSGSFKGKARNQSVSKNYRDSLIGRFEVYGKNVVCNGAGFDARYGDSAF